MVPRYFLVELALDLIYISQRLTRIKLTRIFARNPRARMSDGSIVYRNTTFNSSAGVVELPENPILARK